MPGHYSTRCGARPCLAEPTSLRRFLCARCRAQVDVCRYCDRGQRYCAGSCAQETRLESQRAAGRLYQSSHRGRRNHAARTARYRARQKIVTHQSSLSPGRDDVVPLEAEPLDTVALAATANKPEATSSRRSVMRSQAPEHGCWRCHWCGYRCSPLLRFAFLPPRQEGSNRCHKQGGHHDHPS
jgi:hypothetical protein